MATGAIIRLQNWCRSRWRARLAPVALLWLLVLLPVLTPAGAVELKLVVKAPGEPSEVSMQYEGEITPLDRQAPSTYVGANDVSLPAGFDKVIVVSAAWQQDHDYSEQLFLKARAKISVYIVHDPRPDTPSTLEAIEKDSTRDLLSVLRTYAIARYIYRTSERSKDTSVMIRAWRIWQDSAIRLAVQWPEIFGRDLDVEEISHAYAARAKTDPRFAKVYRLSAPLDGHIDAMLEQLQYAQWQKFNDVGRLIKAGKYDAAAELNDALLAAYNGLSDEEKAKLLKHQGLSGEVLTKTAAWIATLRISQAKHG